MSKQLKPIIHGRDHAPDGADPIPGILTGASWTEIVTDTDLTCWWRLGDSFTFGSLVTDAAADSADFDTSSPRSLDYIEETTGGRPTLGHPNPNLGTDDDGSVSFPGLGLGRGRFGKSASSAVWDVTKLGNTGDEARSWLCWFETPDPMAIIAGFSSPLFGRWDMDPSGSFDLGWVVELNRDTNTLRWRIKNSVPATVSLETAALTEGTWYFAAGTYDGSSYQLYLNGLLADSETSAVVASDPLVPSFRIGALTYDAGAGSATYQFDGAVDEVALYRRVLTADEIATAAGGGGGGGGVGPPGPAGPAGPTGPAGPGVPAGGAAGQVLTKDTTTDYDTSWQAPTGGGGGAPTGPAGGVLDGSYPNPGLAATVAGAGLAETADVLSVNVDGSTLELVSDTLRVKDDGITAAKIAAAAVGTSELADTAVTPGSYGDATHVGQFTVDQDGRLTAATNVAVTGGGGGTVAGFTYGQVDSAYVDYAAVEAGVTNYSELLSGGAILSALLDAKGDLIVASAADTPDRLGVGSSGQILTADPAQALGIKWATPAAAAGVVELAYVEFTSTASVTQTTEAAANTIVSAGAVTYAAVKIKIEFWASEAQVSSGTVGQLSMVFNLWDGSTNIARLAFIDTPQTTAGTTLLGYPIYLCRYLTPSAGSHTYIIKAWIAQGTGASGSVKAGSGSGGTNQMPGFIRVTSGG